MTDAPAADRLTLEQQVSLLSGGDFWYTQALPEAGIRAVTMSDGPHGIRLPDADRDHLGMESSKHATCFPPAVTLGSSWDEELVAEAGAALGREARAHGVHVLLGPGLNIKRHPLCGRNFEYFSEDPLLSGRLAAAMVTGIQSQHVGACLKHFAVNNQETNRFVLDAVVDERTLREIYLSGFEYAVTTSDPWVVMAAYNLINGTHATEHRFLLTDILRGEWGFTGLVVSDWGAVSDRVNGVAAGMDLEMPSSAGLWDAEVIQAVRTGRLPAEAVAASAQRVLDLVARAPELTAQPLAVADHDALARRIAAEGTVLLTNDGILPLPTDCSVAVIGAFAESPRYQGGGSSLVNPTRVTTVLDELRHRAARFTYVAGYDPHTAAEVSIAEAVEAARRADVAVVMVGLPATYESEGFDRDSLDLPAVHNKLVAAICAANPRTVVALSNGAPVRLPWRDQPAAIVESYLGGQASGAALVDVLYGDVEPGGRLAETFPEALGDVAATPWFPGDAHQVQYRECLFVGYRHHVTADLVPAFAFGHGLSYTTFDWTGISLDRPRIRAGEAVTVAVTVTNTGARPGSDVVQVYLHDGTDIVLRPRRQLAGFAKVRLAAGETQTVRISVPGRAFAYYDVVSRCWQVPSGRYQVLVARSSVDIVATVDVDVDDGVTSASEPAGTRPVASGDDDFTRRLGHAASTPRGVRPFTRESTIEELATTPIGRLLRLVVRKAAHRHESARRDAAAMVLFERSVNGLPIRAAANFSHGGIGWPTVDTIVALANGQLATAFKHALTAIRRR